MQDEISTTISITEDDPAIREGLQLILERSGFRTVAIANPRLLLDSGSLLPGLYVIDRQLSGIDGLDLCRVLKSRPETAGVPVIIVSATPHVARLAQLAGADGFLEKPFRGEELLALIREKLSAS